MKTGRRYIALLAMESTDENQNNCGDETENQQIHVSGIGYHTRRYDCVLRVIITVIRETDMDSQQK